ncbi:hypothetical protein acsn021_26910 [Anaerocolumna cellulosilytica]|uniref:Uncharacterized protein n=1 Tax=Anaerocolumna cellulosilytica TaxID=433286 RepID=A0A6S6R6Q6_9FIRM|nr:hypothetical protein [Anaerocolumna cellulosilytica]MBB5197597.1 hypothetical protein [Anaerocolumna cellulosilytica]BCJ95122.1 hypothetical protein acsn021_26910 [Anaerocolumna cellulosilytica]
MNDNLLIEDKLYQILKCEDRDIINPEVFGISPTWKNDKNFEYSNLLIIKDFQLFLKNLEVTSDRGFPEISGRNPVTIKLENNRETVLYEDIMYPVIFTGAVVIAAEILKTYDIQGELPCFSYNHVIELIFQDGKLVTTIDHSKAMVRIRKNLDLRLRSLEKKRDIRCIKRFIDTSFVGDYKHPGKKREKKLKKLNEYIVKLKEITNF